jgi:AcrR family transcriptional regulator
MVRRDRDPERTREILISAGTETFAERGFDGARVGAIAERAGVNKAMISYHFGGKQGLYTAILEGVLGDANAELRKAASESETADVSLRHFIEVWAGIADRRPAFPAMVLREVLSGGRHMDDRVLPLFLGLFEHVRGVVDRGVKDGTFRPVNPLLTHLGLVGSLVFFFATRPFRDRLVREGRLPAAIPDTAGYVRHLQELTTRGLARGGSR